MTHNNRGRLAVDLGGAWRIWWEPETTLRELGFEPVELDPKRLTWSVREAERLNGLVEAARSRGASATQGEKTGRTVKALIATDTKGFPPHIGAVKEKLRKITNPEAMTEVEAWNLVQRAIKRGLYNSREEFDKLPTMLQRLVGSHTQLKDWAMMDLDTVQSVVASNFQRSFKVRAESDRELSLMPPDVRALVGSIANRLYLGGNHGS